MYSLVITPWHVGSQFPDHGFNQYHGEEAQSVKDWIAREVPLTVNCY